MFLASRWFVVLTALLVVEKIDSIVLAQAPGRGPAPREVRGVVKSVDAETRRLTITTDEGGRLPVETVFTLAEDAEIALGEGIPTPRIGVVQAGKLSDLAAGSTVMLTLTDDETTVTSLLAHGPVVRGALKQINATTKQLTVAVFPPPGPQARDQKPEEKTYRLAVDAEIGIDDGRGRRLSVQAGTVADLAAESTVTLQLSASQKEVQAVTAVGPLLFGVVKTAPADGKLSIVISRNGPPREEPPEERTLDVAADAQVWLDDGRGRRLSLARGKLGDVPAGAVVEARLSGDQKHVGSITAGGPNRSGVVKSVDSDKRTITIKPFPTRDKSLEEKSYPIAAGAPVVIDDAMAKLDDIQPADNGPSVRLRLSLDQKTVQAITITTSR